VTAISRTLFSSNAAAFDSYSRLVIALRLLLPSIGILLLALLIVWPLLNRGSNDILLKSYQTTEDLAQEKEGLHNPVFQTLDEEKRPIFFEADHALSNQLNQEEVELSSPTARLNSGLEGEIDLQSESGFYDQKGEKLNLDGVVSVKNSEGFELITDGVEIDLERSEAISNQQVTGHGPSGRVRAEGMEIRNKGGVIFLKGKSTIVMSPEGAGN
jgi:lipopolysaccharide export system protein LptC